MATERGGRRASFSILWMLITEVLVVALLVPTPAILRSMDLERSMAWSMLGRKSGTWLIETADGFYKAHLIDSGVRQAVFDHVLPSEEERQRSRGMQKLGQGWWFPFLEQRLTASFLVIRQLFFRAISSLIWVPFFVAIAIPACIDAMMMWRKRGYEWEYASPMMHRWGVHTVRYIPLVLVLLLFAPIPLPSFVYPIVAAVGALGIHLIGTHLPRMI